MNANEKSEISQEKKHLKLYETHKNNIIISDMNLKNKYTNFEDSKLDESKTLLFEINHQMVKYKRYFRGEIVRVKFGVNIGSEFSGDHFAIVISKGDTMFSPTLHVIPITSKKHEKSLNVGTILYNEEKINELKKQLFTENDINNKKQIQNVINYYEKRANVVSYACIDHIKTVSKLSVDKVLFKKYDYLSKIRCSDELMNTIDNFILNEYTIL
jgi:hypothetical protein